MMPRRQAKTFLTVLGGLFLGASVGPVSVEAGAPDAAHLFPEKRIISSTAPGAVAVFAVDLDGDGDIDVLSSSFGDSTVAWYENVLDRAHDPTLEPVFVRHVISNTARGTLALFAVDLDNDGDVDVIASERDNNRVMWYENDGQRPPSFTPHVLVTNAIGAVGVFAADLNGDQWIDIATASDTDNVIAWYRNDRGHPPQFIRTVITTAYQKPFGIFGIDINRDGGMDLLAAFQNSNQIVWFRNTGLYNPTFVPQVITNNAINAFSVYATHIDGDQFVDILSASFNDDRVAWYKNSGGLMPTFEPHTVSLASGGAQGFSDGPLWVRAADLNGDGYTDILAASRNDMKIAWYENDGAAEPSFTPHAITTTANGAHCVFVIDLDGDGDLDVLSASQFDGVIAWYPNALRTPFNSSRGSWKFYE